MIKIAFEYAKYGAKVMDLIQEGNIGLMRAIRDFNPYKDVRLTTYAVWWIRSYIQDYLLRNWSVVRIGTTRAQKKLFYRLKEIQDNFDEMGIPHGSELQSNRTSDVVKVIGPKKVLFDNVEMSLSAATRQMMGTDYPLAPSPYWTFQGKPLKEIYAETYADV